MVVGLELGDNSLIWNRPHDCNYRKDNVGNRRKKECNYDGTYVENVCYFRLEILSQCMLQHGMRESQKSKFEFAHKVHEFENAAIAKAMDVQSLYK